MVRCHRGVAPEVSFHWRGLRVLGYSQQSMQEELLCAGIAGWGPQGGASCGSLSRGRSRMRILLLTLAAFVFVPNALAAACRPCVLPQGVPAGFGSGPSWDRLLPATFCSVFAPVSLSPSSAISPAFAVGGGSLSLQQGQACSNRRECTRRVSLRHLYPKARGSGLASSSPFRLGPRPSAAIGERLQGGSSPLASNGAATPSVQIGPTAFAAGGPAAGADPAAVTAAAAALAHFQQQVEALAASLAAGGLTPGVCTPEEVETALRVMRGLTSLLLQMGEWRLVPPDLLSSSQTLLLRLTELFSAWESPASPGGPSKGGPTGKAASSGTPLVRLRSAWHIASAYLETVLQLQQQQQQQQRVLQLLLQQKAGDPNSAMMLAEDLLLLHQQRGNCISAVAEHIASKLEKTSETQQHQQHQQQQQQRDVQDHQQPQWDQYRLLEAHGVSAAEAAAVAAALVQQGVAAAEMRRLVSSLFTLRNKQQPSVSREAPECSNGRAAAEETTAQGPCCLAVETHLLLARAFADEGRSSEAYRHLMRAQEAPIGGPPFSPRPPHQGPPLRELNQRMAAREEAQQLATALAVAVASMKDGEMEKACSSLQLLSHAAASRFSHALLPVSLELSRRLATRSRGAASGTAGPDEAQGAASVRLFFRHFVFILQLMKERLLQREEHESLVADMLEQSQLAIASYASWPLWAEVSELVDAVYVHLKQLLSPSGCARVPLTPQQQRLLVAAIRALFAGTAAQRQQGQELLSLLVAAGTETAADSGVTGESREKQKGEIAAEREGDRGTETDMELQRRAIAVALIGLGAAAERLLRATAARAGIAATRGTGSEALQPGNDATAEAAPAGEAAHTAAGTEEQTAAAAAEAAAPVEATGLVVVARQLQSLARELNVPLSVDGILAMGSIMRAASLLGARPEETAVPEVSALSSLSLPSSLQDRQGDSGTAATATQQQSTRDRKETHKDRKTEAVVESRSQLLSLLRRHQQTGNAEAALLLLRRHVALEAAAKAAVDPEGDTAGGRDVERDKARDREREPSKEDGLIRFFAARPNTDCFYYSVATAAAAARPELAFEWCLHKLWFVFRAIRLQEETGSVPSTRTFNAAIKACVAAVSSSPLVASSSPVPASVSSVSAAPTASAGLLEDVRRVASAGFGVYRQLNAHGPFPNYNTFLLTSRLLSAFTAAFAAAPGAAAAAGAEGGTGEPLSLRTPRDAAEAGRGLARDYATSMLKGPLRAKAVHQARMLHQQQQQQPQKQQQEEQEVHQGRQRHRQQQQPGQQLQVTQLTQLQQEIIRQYTPWVHGEAMRAALLLHDYAGALEIFEDLLQLRRRLHWDLQQLQEHQQQQLQKQQQQQLLLLQGQQPQQLLPELPFGVLDAALRALDSLRLMGAPPSWASEPPSPLSGGSLSPLSQPPSLPFPSPRHRGMRYPLVQLAKGRKTAAALLDAYLQSHDAPSVARWKHGQEATTQVPVGSTFRQAAAHAKLRLAKAETIEGWLREYEALQQAHRAGHARLWYLAGVQLADEEQIAKQLVRRFGGLAALKAIQQQMHQQPQQHLLPPQQRYHRHCGQEQEEQQQQAQQQMSQPPLQSLRSNLAATARVPPHVWVAALEYETAQGAPDSVQAIVELLTEIAERDSFLSRQVLLPFTRTFSLLFFFGRFRYARATLDLFSLWISLWREEARRHWTEKQRVLGGKRNALWQETHQGMTHAARLLEAAVRATAGAGRWHLSLGALKLFLSSRTDLIPAVSVHSEEVQPRSDRLHFFHSSVSRVLKLLARQLADHSLVVSRSLEWVLMVFDKACDNWCVFCGAQNHQPCPSESLSVEGLLEQESAFATLERGIEKLMLSLPDGLPAKTPTGEAPQLGTTESGGGIEV